jgi:hypothetical protein
MELRALFEAVKMADGPCTIISDLDGIIRTAQQGKTPETCNSTSRSGSSSMSNTKLG